MSRNFELLSQIAPEHQAGPAGYAPRSTTEHVVEDKAAPSLAGDASDEEIRRFVRSFFLSRNGHAQRQVMFCGVDVENGSSSVCARAARILAASGSQGVCVVDANLRSPRLSSMFGVNRKVVFFEKPASMREQCAQVGKNLWLAGIGFLADEQGNLLPVTELKHRMGQLHDAFGFVLIDVPGASVCEDADIFGQIAGAAILVVEANSTRKVTARKAKVALEDAGVRVLGSVLHNRTFPIPEKLYRRL